MIQKKTSDAVYSRHGGGSSPPFFQRHSGARNDIAILLLLQPHFGVPALFWKAPILLLIDHLAPFVWCSSVKKHGVSFVDYYNSWSKSRLYNNDGKYNVFTSVLIVDIFVLNCFENWNSFTTITIHKCCISSTKLFTLLWKQGLDCEKVE